jgi:3-oxoacyl-[acyl-carrier protein] reductase
MSAIEQTAALRDGQVRPIARAPGDARRQPTRNTVNTPHCATPCGEARDSRRGKAGGFCVNPGERRKHQFDSHQNVEVEQERLSGRKKMSRLSGKVAVVTGASKGIGAAIAKALAAEGASVVVNYASSKAGAEKVVEAIKAAGGKAVAVGGDVSKAAEAQGIIAAAIKNYGRLDVLVNNSGVYEFAPLEAVTEENFHRQFNINVLGLLLTTQAAVKHLGDGGSIINIGSGVSRLTPPNSAVYTATKSAVDAITGVLSKELGPKKIRVNSINPGIVETEGTHAGGFIGSDFEKTFVAQTPLGRIGQPGDIASIAVFLASNESGWLTGEQLLAAGGIR